MIKECSVVSYIWKSTVNSSVISTTRRLVLSSLPIVSVLSLVVFWMLLLVVTLVIDEWQGTGKRSWPCWHWITQIWLTMGFFIVDATLQTSAFRTSQLIIGQIITGLGTGTDSSTVPMYQPELCAKEKRGRLVSTEVLFIDIGIVLAVGFSTNYYT